MNSFFYIKSPYLDSITPHKGVINNLEIRNASRIEQWPICSTFDFLNKFNDPDIEYGRLFSIIPIQDGYDDNIVKSLILSDHDYHVILYGQIYKDEEFKDEEFKIQAGEKLGQFGMVHIGLESPKKINHEVIEDSYVTVAYYNPIYAAVLHYQDKIGRTIKNLDVQMTPQHFYDAITKFLPKSDDYKNIWTSLRDAQDLTMIPIDSPLKILGIVSIIERLITDDSNIFKSSISDQFYQKINLINNQLGEFKLDFNIWFNSSTSNETILKKIYKLRSDIAHGSFEDYSDPKLQELKNKINVFQFLNRLLKRVIYYSITQPELMRDLKNC